jgi:two-component system CheB/CheR fusion protein
VASHDLQEPLRKITTFANRITARHNELSREDLEFYLEKIVSSSERMTALIKNMLQFAKLRNPSELFEQTDLNLILEDIRNDFEIVIEQKDAELQIGELPVLEAIPLQINQLFYNLISNSLKFSRDDVPPVISITSRKISGTALSEHPSLNPKLSYFEIMLRDNGIGFSPEYRDKIFMIFQRLNTTNKYQGTGIGLALCKKIVDNHGGRIFALSKEGEGSTFHVVLPQKQSFHS